MITAEILARSLANFYCQYAGRHMKLKLMRCVSDREVIQPINIVRNKLMSVFNESALLLKMNLPSHNIVKVVCRSTWLPPSGSTATLTIL